MKISKVLKLKKYLTRNIISVIGYFCLALTIIFGLIYFLASSGLNIREDISEYFQEYISKYIIKPYIEFAKFHLFMVCVIAVVSRFEFKHYNELGEDGLRLFINHEKLYSGAFITGVMFNLLPLTVLLIMFMSWLFGLLK